MGDDMSSIVRMIIGQRCYPIDLLSEIIDINQYFSDGFFSIFTLPSGNCCIVNKTGKAIVSITGYTVFPRCVAEQILLAVTS